MGGPGDGRILDRYGEMLNDAIYKADRNSVRVGFAEEYATHREFGTKHMPRRCMIYADPLDGTLAPGDGAAVLNVPGTWLTRPIAGRTAFCIHGTKAHFMGRISRIGSLPEAQQTQVDHAIRSNQYRNLDLILSRLQEQGIPGLSRSGLHRNAGGLKERDAFIANPEHGTVVTIVERGTGEVRVVKTCASGVAITAMIDQITAPDPLS